jgi:hypothetical protein
MNTRTAKIFAGLSLLVSGFFSSYVYADGGPVVYGALTFGGDTLASTEGEYGTDLDAGGLIHLAAGYEWRLAASGLRFTIGYKFDSIEASNGDADISRFPLELVYYRLINERHALGAGLVYELSPEFDISIDGLGSDSVDFVDASGYVIYYGYVTSFGLEYGGRYTLIDYKSDSLGTTDANNFGFYVKMLFQ